MFIQLSGILSGNTMGNFRQYKSHFWRYLEGKKCALYSRKYYSWH